MAVATPTHAADDAACVEVCYGDAKMELFDYIEMFYNQRRRHSTIGGISPAAFEERHAQKTQVG